MTVSTLPDKEIVKKLQETHTPEAVSQRLTSGPDHNYLSHFIYGAIDGTVTTFAVVSGVAGAELSVGIVIIMGMANLIGDGFSMAISNYLGTKADQQVREKAKQTEHLHIKHFPEGEREEIKQIFAAKGFTGEDLERAVNVITSDAEQWVNTMLQDEHGLSLSGPQPTRAALSTFVAFVVAGFIPLLAFVLNRSFPDFISKPFLISSIMTGFTFFLIGALKAKVVDQQWYKSGIETLLVGGSAAVLAYFVGLILKGIATGVT